MQDRNYGDLFTLSSSLIGTVTLAVDECKQLASLINRRFQQAFDESPVWPRYLVVSEKRKIISLLVSGSTSPSVVNQYYYDSGELENGHTKYLGATDPVYKIVKNTEGTQWFLKNSGGTSFYETASSTTVVGHPWEDLTWSAVGTGNGTLVVEDKTNYYGEVVDMEAYALAKICYLRKVPFVSFKYITDGADEQAHEDWEANLADGIEVFKEKVLSEIKR